MAKTIKFGESDQDQASREQAIRLGFYNASTDIADVKAYVDEYTKISKLNNWEKMNLSTAQGGALLDNAYNSATFDGRYMYFGGLTAGTFLRFDTQGQFTVAADWEQMSMSTMMKLYNGPV